MIDRISQLIKTMKLSASQFADEIGVQRSSVSHVLSGRNKPSLDFVTKIMMAYPELNADWLLTGKGMMHSDESFPQLDTELPTGNQLSMEMEDEVSQEVQKADLLKTIEKKKAGSKKLATGQKTIERIVLFYKDGTFLDFTPGGD
ncbi:MAG: transcriptional regulator [Bacteroidetes bacterium]|nr:MAG: transcriptional regulator [Bacteroidota bacterium]